LFSAWGSVSWSSSTVGHLAGLRRLVTQSSWVRLTVQRQSHQHDMKDFRPRTIIFLDQEEGGRLLPEQRAYLHAWADAVQSAGFRPGVYCTGIAFKEGSGATVITAEDIQQNANGRQLEYWVTNDSCPPSPGCALPDKPPNPSASGVPFADAWQFAQPP
jgi:hypothetical protein